MNKVSEDNTKENSKFDGMFIVLGLAALIYVCSDYISGFLTDSIILSYFGWSLDDPYINDLFDSVFGFDWNLYLLFSGLTVAGGVCLVSRFFSQSLFGRAFSFKEKIVWAWIAFGIVEYWLWDATFKFFNVPPNETIMKAMETEVISWLAYPAAIFGAALGEELLYRGLIFTGLAKTALKGHGAIIIAALLFTLDHPHFDGIEYFSVFAGGVIYGYARWHTGTVWVPFVMHAAFDVQSIYFYVPV